MSACNFTNVAWGFHLFRGMQCASLDLLFTDAEYQRRGVATALYRTVEQWARENGVTSVVTEASITAKPFFIHQGFDVNEQQLVQVRGQAFINYKMQKTLG